MYIEENTIQTDQGLLKQSLVDYDSRLSAYQVLEWRNGNHKTSKTSRTLRGNNFVDHSDVVKASPVGGLY